MRDEQLTEEEIEQLLREVEADMPRLKEIKKQQLELFYKLRPERCGKIDFDTYEVKYDDERYTEWHSNFGIELLEDWLKIFDMVELDYELRIADIYYPAGVFSIKYVNTEDDNRKYWVALELHTLYYQYLEELLLENGIDMHKIKEFRYRTPWSGCEKVIAPDRYNDNNALLTEEQILQVLESLYPKAYEGVTAPKPIREFTFEKVMGDKGERRLCKARLDEKSLSECRKNGFCLLSIEISPDKFDKSVFVNEENGRKVYQFEFYIG